MEKSEIQIIDVVKSFGEETVLKGITHTFEAGKIHGIVGFNGSGKTVLFKCICGFIRPTQGQIFVEGDLIGRDIDFPESMGIIIESPGFLSNYSGMQNLCMLAGLKKKVGKKEVGDAMRTVGLDPDSKKSVGKYSLGMRQRLGIAQAIMEDPKLMILDEPFNGLDKESVKQMHELLLGMREKGKTILLASHSAADIDILCDKVVEMDAGVMKQVKY